MPVTEDRRNVSSSARQCKKIPFNVQRNISFRRNFSPTLTLFVAPSYQRFKTGVDSNEARRRREESGTSVRKNKREEGLAKRRQLAEVAEAAPVVGEGAIVPVAGAAAAAAPTKTVYTAGDIPALTAGIRSSDAAAVLQVSERLPT